MNDFLDNASKKVQAAIDAFANSSAGLSGNELESLRKQVPIKKEQDPLWYAEWYEKDYLSVILNSSITQNALRTIADKYYSNQINEIIKHDTVLTKESYPTLYNIYSYCVETLKIKVPPTVYVTSKLKGINALSVETNRCQLILIGRMTTMALTQHELSFILGHELGHHQQGNLAAHTVNGLISQLANKSEILASLALDAIEVPLKRWCRQSEFNADRAGYLCCKDINAVKQLFLKVGMIENVNSYHQYKETSEDHPMLITRYKKLQCFID